MAIDSNSSLVRIYSKDGEVVGGGYLASPGKIITCAHVVAEALDYDETSPIKPSGEIHFDFPQISDCNKPEYSAKVQFWSAVNDKARFEQVEDIAVLSVSGKLPQQAIHAESLALSRDQLKKVKPVRVCGFPEGRDHGVWVDGQLKGPTGPVRIQLDTELGRREITGGFSGTPVWDTETEKVMGIVVAAYEKRKSDQFGYMIPVEALARAWPDLSHYCATTPSGNVTSRINYPEEGEYATPQPHTDWIINTIDHTDQISPVLEKSTEVNRNFFWFHACAEDYPLALAHHLYVAFGDNPGPGELAITLRPGFGPNAYWNALGRQKISASFQDFDIEKQREEVVKWINMRRNTVLYSIFPVRCDTRQISKLIGDACNAFAELQGFAPDSRLLALFCCMQDPRKQSVWKRIWKLKPRIFEQCGNLKPLRLLDNTDTEEWLTGFDELQEQRYDKERLRSGLRDLFSNAGGDVRYDVVRRYLLDEGLPLARKSP